MILRSRDKFTYNDDVNDEQVGIETDDTLKKMILYGMYEKVGEDSVRWTPEFHFFLNERTKHSKIRPDSKNRIGKTRRMNIMKMLMMYIVMRRRSEEMNEDMVLLSEHDVLVRAKETLSSMSLNEIDDLDVMTEFIIHDLIDISEKTRDLKGMYPESIER